MWYEYSIPADFELQKQIIRELRKWIQKIAQEGYIKGFAFNFYFNNPQRGNVLCIRFDYQNEENRKTVEDELAKKVVEFVPDYVLKRNTWNSQNEGELEAYEFGSRCAFLFWDLVEKGRFKEDYVSNFIFQICSIHGIINSLGIPKVPDELNIHLKLLMDFTNSKSTEELYEWLKRNKA